MPRLIPSISPSRRATAHKFPEEFSWWRASGWEMQAEDAPDGRMLLHTSKKTPTGSTRLWGTQATADLIRHFLTISLYLHLHPHKASAHHADTGAVATDAELAAFIRVQRCQLGKVA